MDWLTYLSLSPPDMLAGFLGGIINYLAPWSRRTGPKAACASVVGGPILANYLSIPLATVPYIGTGPHAGAFLIGAIGVGGFQSVIERTKLFRRTDAKS